MKKRKEVVSLPLKEVFGIRFPLKKWHPMGIKAKRISKLNVFGMHNSKKEKGD